MRNKYPKILFVVDSNSTCCGTREVHSFELQDNYPRWYITSPGTYIPPVKYTSRKAQMAQFEEDLFEFLEESIQNDNNNSGGGYLLTATLLKYNRFNNELQLPELQKYLLKSGWKITNTFRNRNTGNDINFFTKFITEAELIAKASVESDDEDDEN